MMDDLISRKYVAKILTDPAYPYEPGIERAIMELPSVPAVPLDKLCEWLGKFANPCKIGIRCYYDNDCDCMPTVECWRYVLTKWMEEQQ